MNAQLDLGRVVTDWLRAEASASGSDRVLAATLTRVATVRQEVHRPTLRFAAMNAYGKLELSTYTKILIATAAVLFVAVVGISLLPSTGGDVGVAPAVSPPPSHSDSPVPSSTPRVPPTDVGFIGLPARGATPSTPKSGVLVDSYPVHGGGVPFEGMVRLYADGRMIWYMFYDGPNGHNGHSTGFLEQRLTSEGVELVRTHDSLAEKDPLVLPDWLPASAWADQQIRAYVPPNYAACLEVFDPDAPIEERQYPNPGAPTQRSQMLALLPAAAATLLRDKATLPPSNDAHDCLVLTIEEARQLDAALGSAGLAQDDRAKPYVLQYHRDAPGPGTARIEITFEPIFPDGTSGCSACG